MKERLTSIETLPEAAAADLQWLFDAIKGKRKSQIDMLEEFNRRLEGLGIDAVSRSGLNRYVMKVRNGGVSRPESPPNREPSSNPTGVFDGEFRKKLVKKQGLHTVALLEAAMSALLQG